MIGRADELPFTICGDPLRGTVVDPPVHDSVAQVLNARLGDCRFCRRLTVDADVSAAGARPSNTGVLDVGTTLAVDDRRGQGVEGFVVDEGESLTQVTGNQIGELKVQARDQVGLTEATGSSRLLNRHVVVADRA